MKPIKSLNIDLTSFSAAHGTLIELFQIYDKEYLVSDYFIGRERDDISVETFIEFAGIKKNPLENTDVSLTSLHVTTNNDACNFVLKHGLVDLQEAVIVDTPLRKFLNSYGIKLLPDQYQLKVNGEVLHLNPESSGSSAVEKDQQLEYVSYKLYKDYPICGFICSDNVLGYGGHVNLRPEFLNNLSNLLNKPELVDDWECSTETYVLKFRLPLDRYELPSNISDIYALGDLIVKTVYDYSMSGGGGPLFDVYSFVKPGERVKPDEIVACFTVDEFKLYLNS